MNLDLMRDIFEDLLVDIDATIVDAMRGADAKRLTGDAKLREVRRCVAAEAVGVLVTGMVEPHLMIDHDSDTDSKPSAIALQFLNGDTILGLTSKKPMTTMLMAKEELDDKVREQLDELAKSGHLSSEVREFIENPEKSVEIRGALLDDAWATANEDMISESKSAFDLKPNGETEH